MKVFSALAILLTALYAAAAPVPVDNAELDAYWTEMARTVAEGDFDAYAAGYHPDAVLVSVGEGTSYPIAQALAGWKPGFDDTRDGHMVAGVEFAFTQRLSDETTAHESGMFRYSAHVMGSEPTVMTVHFEALLVKMDGAWKTVMEYQKEPATPEEWDAARQ